MTAVAGKLSDDVDGRDAVGGMRRNLREIAERGFKLRKRQVEPTALDRGPADYRISPGNQSDSGG